MKIDEHNSAKADIVKRFAEEIVFGDFTNLMKCDAFFGFLPNTRVTGTVYELGWAYYHKKNPIFLIDPTYNPFSINFSTHVFMDIDDLKRNLYKWVEPW